MPLSSQQLEQQIGFAPNSGLQTHIHAILTSATMQNDVRSWLQTQGIPFKAAKSSLPASLAQAYTNRRYLRTWRNRINPSFELLGGSDDEASATLGNVWPQSGDNVNPLNLPPMASATPAPVAPPTAVASEAWLKDLFAQIQKTVNVLTEEKLSKATLKLDDSAREAIKTLAKQAAEAKIEELATPRVIEINNAITGETTSLGLQHSHFEKLLRATQARDHRGFRLNIWLTGPTGSGKTTAAENAAKALSLPFGSDGSLDADYKVLGFRDANGNVISTQFLDIYEKGGIYVADEIDNWLPSALLSLNAALANGWCSSPRGLIKRHPDACVIACANTWGLGATSDYVGRTKLDAASLDRFQPKIEWPIDQRLERALAEQSGGTLGLQWHDIVIRAREATKRQGLKIIISPRGTFGGIALLKAGFEAQEVVDMTLASGISPNQKKALGLDNITMNEAIVENYSKEMDAFHTQLEGLIRDKQIIQAIKLYRDKHNVELITAKDAVQLIRERIFPGENEEFAA